jgi:CubicO group peptidase (beta-lactamase class C family)
MMPILKWLLRIVGGLLGVAGAALVTLLLVIWVADPTVLRNMLFGQLPTDPTGVEKSQPQEAVPGASAAALSLEPAQDIAAEGLAAAEAYATATESVALLVWHRGALRYEKYWAGFGPETRTNPNSMHKTVLALLVGAAVADGYIDSADAPAAKWLTEWQDDARREVTVRELLQMASGLEIPVFGTWKSAKILLGSDLAGGVLALQSAEPHGSRFQYSNASSQLLTILLERATGQRYSSYLSERLWKPLGAADAALWMDREGGLPRGFCCIFATGRDWLRVGLLILERGRVGERQLIPAAWIDEMLTPSPRNPNFGMHVWLGSPPQQERPYNDYSIKAFHSEPFAASDVVFIDGFGGQRVYVVPSLELIIVRTGKSQTDWDDARLPNALIRAIRQAPFAEEVKP